MTHEEIEQYENNVKQYKELLKSVYMDSTVSGTERQKLESLRLELGISLTDAATFEQPFKACIDEAKEERKDKRELLRYLMHLHHCDLFDHDNELQENGIDYTSISWLEFDNILDEDGQKMYIETTDCGYTGLNEQYALTIGTSFSDLLDEYGENNIYDAVEDGKLIVFDSQNDMLEYIFTRFNLLSLEDFTEEYCEPSFTQVGTELLIDYFTGLEKVGYALGLNSAIADANKESYERLAEDFSDFISAPGEADFYLFKNPLVSENDMPLPVFHSKVNTEILPVSPDDFAEQLTQFRDDNRLTGDFGEFVEGLSDSLDMFKSDKEKSMKVPLDISLDVLIPIEYQNETLKYGGNIQQSVYDKIALAFPSASDEENPVYNAAVLRGSGNMIQMKITHRYEFTMPENFDYLSNSFADMKKQLERYLKDEFHYDLKELLPEEQRNNIPEIKVDNVSFTIPTRFHFGRFGFDLDNHNVYDLMGDEKSYEEGLGSRALAFAGSSVERELIDFRQNKANAEKIFSKYPAIKQFYNDVADKRVLSTRTEKYLTYIELTPREHRYSDIYVENVDNGNLLKIQFPDAEKNRDSWHYALYDNDVKLIKEGDYLNTKDNKLSDIVYELTSTETPEIYSREFGHFDDLNVYDSHTVEEEKLYYIEHPKVKDIYEELSKTWTRLDKEETKQLKEVINDICEAVEENGSLNVNGSPYDVSEDAGYIRDYIVEQLFNGKGSGTLKHVGDSIAFCNDFAQIVDDAYSDTEFKLKQPEEHFWISPEDKTSECITMEAVPEWAVQYMEFGYEAFDLSDFKPTEEEIEMLENWKKANNIGSLDQISQSSYFSSHPAFGEPGTVYDCTFHKNDYNYDQEVTINELVDSKNTYDAADKDIAKTPEDAKDLFVKLTNNMLSLQPVKNPVQAMSYVLESFSEDTKNLLNQYFEENDYTTERGFDIFFDKNFRDYIEYKPKSSPAKVAEKSVERKEPEIEKASPELDKVSRTRKPRSREHDIGMGR